MKTLRLLSLIVILLVPGLISANPISKDFALKQVQQFYSDNVKKGLRSNTDFQLVYTDTGRVINSSKNLEFVCFYVFNAGDDEGFVIVSGDDIVRPILAYSDVGSFPTRNIPENVSSWLKFYNKEIQYAVANTTYDSKINLRTANKAVAPLLGNIKWNQDEPYNLLCPYSIKESLRTLTGCVATAMAQVMKYHNWPITGTDSHSYKFKLNSDSIELSADFGHTTYKWSDMLDDYNISSTPAQDSAVALLMSHCGIASNMSYSASESGTTTFDATRALIKYFGYDSDIQYLDRKEFYMTRWSEILENEIDSGRPVIYSGFDPDSYSGHAFVCDGYDNDGLFHINWGWGGYYNGYFMISILNPMSNTEGYTRYQSAIIGIQKPDSISRTPNCLYLYESGLTSSKSSLVDISSDRFDINWGLWNRSFNNVQLKIGIGLYKDGIFQKILGNAYTQNFGPRTGLSATSSNLSLSGLEEGKYKFYLVYQPIGSNTWYKADDGSMPNKHLEVTINGISALIIKPSLTPYLVQASAINVNGKIYKNRLGHFDISVKNDGTEFCSYLSLYICSATNPSVNKYLKRHIAVIKSDEVLSIHIADSMNLAPGSYYAYAVYDSTNSFSYDKYKRVSLSSFQPFQFVINSEPVAPLLTINKALSIEGGNTIYKDKTFNLNAEIKNTGGLFENQIVAYIYPSYLPESSFGYMGLQSIYLDTDETKNFTLTGSYGVSPGNYKIALLYKMDDWIMFTPSDNNSVYVTMQDPVEIEKTKVEKLHLKSTIAGESLEIITNENILQAEIYNLSGQILGRFNNSSSIPAGNLNEGSYILRVRTDRGIFNVRFIKSKIN